MIMSSSSSSYYNGLSKSQADLLYLSIGLSGSFYPITNPYNFIRTIDADNRYLPRSSGSSFYPASNPNKYITSNNLVGLMNSGNSISPDYLIYTKVQSGLLDAPLNNTIIYTLKSGANLQVMVGFNNNGTQFRTCIPLISGGKNKEDLGFITQGNNWTT